MVNSLSFNSCSKIYHPHGKSVSIREIRVPQNEILRMVNSSYSSDSCSRKIRVLCVHPYAKDYS